MAQARAAVAEARADLDRIRAAGRPSEIEAQRAGIAALSAQKELAVREADHMPLTMTFERAAMVFGLIFGMCAAAGLLAMRKLRDASPADMF